ncbi:MAG: hypothetical protein ACFFDT_19515 [Candidatus Hodarchaeota archaeon]
MKEQKKNKEKEVQPEVRIDMPELGLSQDQLDKLVKSFENSLVATLSENVARKPRPRPRRRPKAKQWVGHPPLEPIPVRRPPKRKAAPQDEPNE